MAKNKNQKTSKFIREYGMTLQQMSEKYSFTTWYLTTLHLKGELHAFIKERKRESEKIEVLK